MKTYLFALSLIVGSFPSLSVAMDHTPPPPRPVEVCGGNDDETPFFKKGPRSDVLNKVVDALGTEFAARKTKTPKKAKAVLEAEALESDAIRDKLIEARISFKEFEEIVRRWNEKEKRAVEVVPRTKRDYREALRQTFDRVYDEDRLIQRKAQKLADLLDKRQKEDAEALQEAVREALKNLSGAPPKKAP